VEALEYLAFPTTVVVVGEGYSWVARISKCGWVVTQWHRCLLVYGLRFINNYHKKYGVTLRPWYLKVDEANSVSFLN
jgi:hypothetical protein